MALNRVAGDRGEWLVILEDHEDGVEAMEAGMSSEPNGKLRLSAMVVHQFRLEMPLSWQICSPECSQSTNIVNWPANGSFTPNQVWILTDAYCAMALCIMVSIGLLVPTCIY